MINFTSFELLRMSAGVLVMSFKFSVSIQIFWVLGNMNACCLCRQHCLSSQMIDVLTMRTMKLKSFVKTHNWKFRIKKAPDIQEGDWYCGIQNTTEADWSSLAISWHCFVLILEGIAVFSDKIVQNQSHWVMNIPFILTTQMIFCKKLWLWAQC